MRHLSLLLFPLLLTGCITTERVGYDPSEYILLERGQPQTLHALNLFSHSLVVVGAGREDIILIDAIPQAGDQSALGSARQNAPYWRRVRTLTSVARKVAAGSPSRICWIISLRPLVFAIGDATPVPATRDSYLEHPSLWNGGPTELRLPFNLKLPKSSDMKAPVHEAWIQPDWGEESRGDITESTALPAPEKIDIPPNATIRLLQATQPWTKNL